MFNVLVSLMPACMSLHRHVVARLSDLLLGYHCITIYNRGALYWLCLVSSHVSSLALIQQPLYLAALVQLLNTFPSCIPSYITTIWLGGTLQASTLTKSYHHDQCHGQPWQTNGNHWPPCSLTLRCREPALCMLNCWLMAAAYPLSWGQTILGNHVTWWCKLHGELHFYRGTTCSNTEEKCRVKMQSKEAQPQQSTQC